MKHYPTKSIYRTKRTACFLLLYLSALTFVSIRAQSTTSEKRIKVYGYVLDEGGKGLELVNIKVMNKPIGTSSSLTGYFELYVPSKDTTHLLFSSIGYETSARTIPPTRNDIQLKVSLSPISTGLGEVTVSATRRQTSTMQKIGTDKIKLMPDASGNSIESMIVTLAGVSSNNELSSQYSVRGGNFDENSVYINGIEVYRPLLIRAGQQEGLSIINADMVQEVAFSAGGFDAKYADKMSSVLDITYKRPASFEAAATASFMGATAYVGHSNNRFSQMHGLRYKSNRSLLGSLDTKGEYDPKFFDYQTYLTYEFSPKWDLSFLGNISQNNYNFKPQDRQTTFGTYNYAKKFKVYFEGQERDLFQTAFGAFALNHHINERNHLSLQLSAFGTHEQENYDILGQYWLSDLQLNAESGEKEETEVSGVGSYMEHARNRLQARVLTATLSGEHQLRQNKIQWGATIQSERIKDRINEWEMRDSSGYSLPHNGETVEMIYSLRSQADISSIRFNSYLQDTYRTSGAWGTLHLTGGVRASYWSYNDELIVSPRASIGFVPKWKSDWVFRLSGGIFYQAPFYKEFRDTVYQNGIHTVQLNDKIKSQKSTQIIFGSDYTFRAIDRPFKLTSELYYKKLSNLVPYNVDNVRVRYYGRNMADGYIAGIDLKLFGEFVPGSDSWITLSLLKTEETINGKTVPRPTDQLYNISFYFQDYLPGNERLKVNLKAIWADGLPVAAPRKGREDTYFRTSPYRRIDIGASYMLLGQTSRRTKSMKLNWIKNLWVGVDVFNLLDLRNVNSLYWVTDIYGTQLGVPNYLTARQFNLKLSAEF